MRGIFSRAHSSVDRLLIVESGPREITEKLLPHFYHGQECRQLDVLTCFASAPAAFDPARGALYYIHSADIAQDRRRFIRRLIGTPYTAVAIICAGSAILRKWKWTIGLFTSAKLLIVDGNADVFPFDVHHHRVKQSMLIHRRRILNVTKFIILAGELLIVPFTIAYLLLYACAVHVRRLLRARTAP